MSILLTNGGAKVLTLAGGGVPRKTAGGAASSALEAAAFTYLGAAVLPYSGGGDNGIAVGLAHRYRAGTLEFFTGYLDNPNFTHQLKSFTLPQLSPGSFPSATVVRSWASYSGGKQFASLRGLLWDETTQRLYWNDVNGYNSAASYPSFGYSTLNDNTGAVTGYGPWGLPSNPNYKAIKGLCHLPASLFGTKRFGAGFGGPESMTAYGPSSQGPSLTAFDPAVATALPANSYLSQSDVSVLMNYPSTGTRWASRGDTDFNNMISSGPPAGPVDYWGNQDFIQQSGCWVETGTKAGFILFARLATGSETATVDGTFTPVAVPAYGTYGYTVRVTAPWASLRVGDFVRYPTVPSGPQSDYASAEVKAISGVEIGLSFTRSGYVPTPQPATSGTAARGQWYYDSTEWSTAGTIGAFVYDPATLTAGSTSSLVTHNRSWALACPNVPSPLPSWKDAGGGVVSGVTFDSTTGRLYVLLPYCYPWGYIAAASMVMVYQVA